MNAPITNMDLLESVLVPAVLGAVGGTLAKHGPGPLYGALYGAGLGVVGWALTTALRSPVSAATASWAPLDPGTSRSALNDFLIANGPGGI